MNKINLNMIYQWPLKKQISIFAAIFIIVFLFGYNWDLSTIKRKIVSSQQGEVDVKQQLNAIFANEANHMDELAVYPEYQNKVASWTKKLITRPQMPALIKDILKLGAVNNIYFSLFDPIAEEQDETYTRIPINMVMVGSYSQLAVFVSQIANLPQLVSIKKFLITNENKADELGAELADKAAAEKLLTAKMRIEIYLMPENTAHVK